MNDPSNFEALVAALAALAAVNGRADAARRVAVLLDADDAIVFVRDDAVGRSLPAIGFPQTLQEGRVWHALVERAIADGSATGSVTYRGAATPAHAIGCKDGTAIVLLGGDPATDSSILSPLIGLAGALFRVELAANRSGAEATVARQSAAQAAELAAKLDVARVELQRAVAVAETATRARDEFLATVSHELRTPLTSILGWVQLMRASSVDPAALSEALETIERSARSQSRLIEDILDFSRIYAGKMRLDVRAVEPVDVVSAAIEIVRPPAEAKGVKLNTVLDPNAGPVSGDADRLQQVVWNLLSNAVKFTPRGGRVQVRLERVSSHCELSVSDTGQGISPEFLPYVFDRFSQADSTSARMHGGLGLGLGIVRHLTELHGGTVRAMSDGLGQGATFFVRLPLMVAQSQRDTTVAQETTATRAGELHGVRIITVEDNEDARRLITKILERSGATVEAFDSVASVLERLTKPAEPRPNLILSDIEMPGEDGYSFIGKLRLMDGSLASVPAIALTAYARPADRVRALAAGFQMHMSKPVEPAELVAAVKSLARA